MLPKLRLVGQCPAKTEEQSGGSCGFDVMVMEPEICLVHDLTSVLPSTFSLNFLVPNVPNMRRFSLILH